MSMRAVAAPLYQVDVIVFTHQATLGAVEQANARSLSKSMQGAITLQPKTAEGLMPYQLLPAALSGLRQESWALRHQSNYHVLGQYAWLQPANSERAIALPSMTQGDWDVKGIIRVRQGHYYLLDTTLLFSDTTHHESFAFAQTQRLKSNVVYYVDHPQAGLLIKIHTQS